MRTHCPACLEQATKPSFAVEGHRFRRCRRCHTLFLEQPPELDATASVYPGERYFTNPEYEHGDYCGYKDYIADRAEIEQKFAQVLSHLERYVDPGRLLDVGAGPGFLVHVAGLRGWQAEGLDVNPWSAAYARDQVGVQVQHAALEEAAFPDDHFDAVTMLDLLEHVADPSEKIAEAARITRPAGVIALLTPDAGSMATRLIGSRWPEAQRVPEHVNLFSVKGLSELLQRNGWQPLGWHTVGKTTSVATLLADLRPVAPAVGETLQRALGGRRVAQRRFEFDPHAKFCLYARLTAAAVPPEEEAMLARLPIRISKLPAEPEPDPEIGWDLREMAAAERLTDWMFDQYRDAVHGRVAEVGAGIGTFAERLRSAEVDELVLLEPDPACSIVLRDRYGSDARVRITQDVLPEAPSLRQGSFDLIVCQNVLEHIEDDAASVAAMAEALAPQGQLTILVPAHPRLYGALDDFYGHHRRYTRARLRRVAEASGLEVSDLYSFNLLGVLGWWVKNRRPGARVSPRSLAAYEALVRFWRPLEERLRPPWGLSLIVHARRP
jgi:2-polyprenyl-3-methyl-5-hydroxy-6-metoxy-1,4-benzoquinol methylase